MSRQPEPPRWIGIFVFDTMEEIDAVGPWEVFAWWTTHFPEDGWAATTFSADGGPVTCEKTLVIDPHHSAASVPALDVFVHPGGDGTDRMLDDEAHLDWMREQRATVPLVTSVCTGAVVLAAAGLLKGREATSNRNRFDQLNEIDPTIEVHRGVRYVDDGDVITSGGLSAGIDMALHIVGRLASPARSGQVAEGIEFEYEPGRFQPPAELGGRYVATKRIRQAAPRVGLTGLRRRGDAG